MSTMLPTVADGTQDADLLSALHYGAQAYDAEGGDSHQKARGHEPLQEAVDTFASRALLFYILGQNPCAESILHERLVEYVGNGLGVRALRQLYPVGCDRQRLRGYFRPAPSLGTSARPFGRPACP